jgi:uncharacterized membrane protein SpoIIM required for sporulation
VNQQDFELRHEAYWQSTESLIDSLNQRQHVTPLEVAEFPARYRQVCKHLAIARERQYASHLTERLNQLMLRGHQHLYSARAGFLSAILHFIGAAFPALIRREWRLFSLAFLLFYGPALLMGWAVYERPEMAYTLMSPGQISQVEEMYRPDAPHIGRERGADNDFYMFGAYIWNNIRIGFQTFAGGIFFGIGSIFFLLFNGLYIGVIAGRLTEIGYTQTFWPFVAGHGAFELTAIVLSGMAGLKLGFALLSPGRKTRLDALREAAKISIKIIYGVIGMLVIAAFLEAFWSASTLVSPTTKYSVAAVLWTLVVLYFLLVGRGHAD